MRKDNIVVAFGSVPKDSGTFTFYRSLRPILQRFGVDLLCVSVGKHEANLWDSSFADEGCILIAKEEANIKNQSIAFVDWCKANAVDIVIGVNSVAILSALPHLPQHVRVMSRCANAFDHGYKITMSCYERLSRIIATTPRLQHDLVKLYGANPHRIELIPNGVEPINTITYRRFRGPEKPLRLGFVGRLEHNQKGVFFLPDIIDRLDKKGIDFTLRIAGKGVHKKALEKRMGRHINDGRVILVGTLTSLEVTNFLADVDVFVFVSQFEGCPNALLEAMMAGCVPVVFQINGITDFIVRDKETGYVCPMADYDMFAEKVAELSENRRRLKEMAISATNDARARFSNERAAGEYARLFKKVMEEPPPPWSPVTWSAFKSDPAFKRTKINISFLPIAFKNSIKNCLYKLGFTDRYYG